MNKALQVNETLQTTEACISEHSIAHLKFTAQWHDESSSHMAIQHLEKFNVWRDMDLLPENIKKDILYQPVGKGEKHQFNSGDLVPAWQDDLLVTLPRKNFHGRLKSGEVITPHVGRYYPKGWFSGVNGIYSENMFPARLVDIQDDKIIVDYNHPLASKEISLGVDIVDIFPPSDEHGGRCSEAIETLLNNGPGMQMAAKNTRTDFFVDGAFDRIDDNDDSVFYQTERKVQHLDANARNTISELYDDLIAPGSRVLDLMASWDSHLPESLSDINLSGLGMNEAELKENPALNDFLIHDLNKKPATPYENETFDAVICTASVEYLTDPLAVFAEVKRILKPGGICIVTFSNRWFPTKAIKLWPEMHEFERIGLVTEYFRKSGWMRFINTLSSRGMHRPEDDPHYLQTQISDPVYAVWCQK